MQDLKTLKLQLALLRTGCLLVAEGHSRATSSELLFRSKKEQSVDALPSTVGQLLGSLGLPTSTSKGKTRFLLDPDHIEPLMSELDSQVQEIESRVDSAIKAIGNVQGRLEPLEQRFQRVHGQLQREQELQRFLDQHRPTFGRTSMLEFERQQTLKAQVQRMEQELKSGPELEKRRRQLAQRVKQLEAQKEVLTGEEGALAEAEKQVAGLLSQLKLGRAWVTLAFLERDFAQAQAQLEEVKDQINQHRSWLDRLLHRDEGGAG